MAYHSYSWTSLDCNWKNSTDRDNYYECNDGTFCEGNTCCNDMGGRKRCPKNMPIMCSAKICGNGTDYCCSINSDGCQSGAGGPRLCGTWHIFYIVLYFDTINRYFLIWKYLLERFKISEMQCCNAILLSSTDYDEHLSENSFGGIYSRRNYTIDGRAVYKQGSRTLYWASTYNTWIVSSTNLYILRKCRPWHIQSQAKKRK